MNKRLGNIKANAKNLCCPATAGDFGVVLNVVWLETIERLCDEVAKLKSENEALREVLLAHIPRHAEGTQFEGEIITGSATTIETIKNVAHQGRSTPGSGVERIGY